MVEYYVFFSFLRIKINCYSVLLLNNESNNLYICTQMHKDVGMR